MRHAHSNTLATLEPLLRRIREYSLLIERTPGSFYLKSKAYLHFHEDPTGTYADVKLNLIDFTRLRVTTSKEQAHLLSLIGKNLKGGKPATVPAKDVP